MFFKIQQITSYLSKNPKYNPIIGIDGGQGAGKSTFIKHFKDNLIRKGYNVISLETDDFLVKRDQRTNLKPYYFSSVNNLEHLFNFSRMARVIKKFRNIHNQTITLNQLYNTISGKKDRAQRYVFQNNNIIIVGGPYLLHPLFPKFDIKIFLHVNKSKRLHNTLIRTLIKKRSTRSQKKLFNNFEQFYSPYFSKRLSSYHLIIDNNNFHKPKIIKNYYQLPPAT